jgi:hypothetical protein
MTDDRRPTDDHGGTDDRPPARFESRLPHGDRSPLVPIAALVLLVTIATLTSTVALPRQGEGPALAPPLAGTGTRGGSPPPSPSSRADAAVASICLEPGSWRTATVETWRDRTVRVWRAIDPAPAAGPDDPAIPIVPAVGSRIAAIGFCAPVVGPDKPAGPATIDAWRRAHAAGNDGSSGGTAVPIELRGIVPAGSPSPFGALFGPPDPADGTSGWPPGVIVFRYAQPAAGSTTSETWFGIEVLLTDASGRQPTSSDPAGSGGGRAPRP